MLRVLSGRIRPAVCCAAMIAVAAVSVCYQTAPASASTVRQNEAWVLAAMNVPSAWPISRGSGVTVAVIDSGVDPTVSDLVGSVRSGPDLTGVSTLVSNPNWGMHGTWMASLIAGHGDGPDDADGIIGVAPLATVLSIRVITDKTDPNYSRYEQEPRIRGQQELAAAIRYAVSHGAGVISLSLGYTMPSSAVRSALQDAFDHDVLVVASAGNSGSAADASGRLEAPYSFPADYPGVLSVAAVGASGGPASFSSENLSVQVAAPGVSVPAEGRENQYWFVSGTSPACALVAGVAALIKARYPGLSDPQVDNAITTTTTDRPAGGYDQQVGFGTVDAAAALTAAGRLAVQPPQRSAVSVSSHFGGGPHAVPAPPIQPRGLLGLVLFCLLGIGCLVVVGIGTRQLRLLRSAAGPAQAPGYRDDQRDDQPGQAISGNGWSMPRGDQDQQLGELSGTRNGQAQDGQAQDAQAQAQDGHGQQAQDGQAQEGQAQDGPDQQAVLPRLTPPGGHADEAEQGSTGRPG